MQGLPLPPPPQPLPNHLWGDRWRFATLPAAQLVSAFQDQPIPVLHLPSQLHPIALGIASSVDVPGLVIDGGRRSLTLARWLQAARPVAATCVPGPPGGLVLATETGDRWVLVTFEDPDVALAGEMFEQRKQNSQGLHFLLVQPDDSGMTYSGFWLLRSMT